MKIVVILLLVMLMPVNLASAQEPLVTCLVPYPKVFCGDNDVLTRCTEDGARSVVVKECDSKEICKNKEGLSQCVKAQEETNIAKWSITINVILGLLILVMLYFLIRKSKKKKK